MKHTIAVGDDYLIRQSPTHDGYGIRIGSAAAGCQMIAKTREALARE
jgi:hypothetical protein